MTTTLKQQLLQSFGLPRVQLRRGSGVGLGRQRRVAAFALGFDPPRNGGTCHAQLGRDLALIQSLVQQRHASSPTSLRVLA